MKKGSTYAFLSFSLFSSLIHVFLRPAPFSSCALSVRFKEQLNSQEPKEILSQEEYEELRASCRQSQKAERAEQAQEEEEERPPGEEEPATPEGTDTVSNTRLPHIQPWQDVIYSFKFLNLDARET